MIGKFRRLIGFLAAEETPDEAGGRRVSFVPTDSLWAAVELLSPVEGADGAPRRRLRILTRARADFALGARLRFEAADYEIASIESDDDKGRRVFLTAEEAL